MSLEASRLLDGDLQGDDLARMLDGVAADAQKRDRYTIYALIGDVLRGHSTPDDGFSMRIFERMQADGIGIEPGYDPLTD